MSLGAISVLLAVLAAGPRTWIHKATDAQVIGLDFGAECAVARFRPYNLFGQSLGAELHPQQADSSNGS